MMILAVSAAFVGLVHSLAPGHWLPVVLMAKTKRWDLKRALLGAAVAASGHILVSTALGLASLWVEATFLTMHEEEIERYGGLGLILFGLIYAGLAYRNHHRCHGHTHHGPNPRGEKAPFFFLFMLGLSPCVAVLPVFAAAAALGSFPVFVTMVAFSAGVLAALGGGTLLVTKGLMKLDHPILEHYGDVITGLGVAVMGCALFLIGGHHH